MDPLIECEDESNCDITIKSVGDNQMRKSDSSERLDCEKSQHDEKIQSKNKLHLNGTGIKNVNSPVKSISRKFKELNKYRQEYDELPADPDERYKFFVDEYSNIMHDLKAQNKIIEQFLRLLREEIKANKDKNSLNQLKSLIETEFDKVDGLIVKALRIQKLYPGAKWEPIPPNNHRKDISLLLSEEKKYRMSSQTTSTIKNCSTKYVSRTASTTSTTSNQSRKCNYSVSEKSKESKLSQPTKLKPKNSTSKCVIREGSSTSSLRSKSCTNTNKSVSSSNIKSSNSSNSSNNSSNLNSSSKLANVAKKRSATKTKLDDKYTELMDVLKYKENELQDMLDTIEVTFDRHLKQQTRSLTGQDQTDESSSETDSNMKYLQRKVSILQLEQKEFRRQIQTQQDAIEKYHKKFIDQKHAIESLEASNKHMENDINNVIVNLKESYESKLKDFAAFPRLLKLEKQKLEAVTRDKREIESKFKLLKKEFEYVKQKLEEKSKKVTTTSNDRLKAIKRELQVFRNFNVCLRDERDRLAVELRRSKSELDHFRAESNKLLFRTRDQAETQRRVYQKKINELQTELLTNRASNTCFLKQRNKVIDDIQSQLNDLKENFQISESHIDNLKKHISTLSMSTMSPQSSQSDAFIK